MMDNKQVGDTFPVLQLRHTEKKQSRKISSNPTKPDPAPPLPHSKSVWTSNLHPGRSKNDGTPEAPVEAGHKDRNRGFPSRCTVPRLNAAHRNQFATNRFHRTFPAVLSILSVPFSIGIDARNRFCDKALDTGRAILKRTSSQYSLVFITIPRLCR